MASNQSTRPAAPPVNQTSDERRVHARHLTRLRVQLIRNDTLPQRVRTVELSKGGMHIETDRATCQLLVPPQTSPEGVRPFTARIIPPEHDGSSHTMTVQVEVISVKELDDDLFRVGLHFTCFFGKSRELLSQMIDSLPEHE